MNKTGNIVVLGCKKCGKCDSICRTGAISRPDGTARIDQEKCDLCMCCIEVCPNKALILLD